MEKHKFSGGWYYLKKRRLSFAYISKVTGICQSKISLYLHCTHPIVPKDIRKSASLAMVIGCRLDDYLRIVEIDDREYKRLSQCRAVLPEWPDGKCGNLLAQYKIQKRLSYKHLGAMLALSGERVRQLCRMNSLSGYKNYGIVLKQLAGIEGITVAELKNIYYEAMTEDVYETKHT